MKKQSFKEVVGALLDFHLAKHGAAGANFKGEFAESLIGRMDELGFLPPHVPMTDAVKSDILIAIMDDNHNYRRYHQYEEDYELQIRNEENCNTGR
jgi:hypothetical protein